MGIDQHVSRSIDGRVVNQRQNARSNVVDGHRDTNGNIRNAVRNAQCERDCNAATVCINGCVVGRLDRNRGLARNSTGSFQIGIANERLNLTATEIIDGKGTGTSDVGRTFCTVDCAADNDRSYDNLRRCIDGYGLSTNRGVVDERSNCA